MTIGEISGLVGSFGGGCWWLWSKVLKPLRDEEKERKKKMLQMIADIKNELSFNGGGSMKDAIYHIKDKVNNIEFRLDSLDEMGKLQMNVQGVAFWLSNEKGECIYASPALCRIMGRTEDEIKGNNWASWLIKEDKERIFDAWFFSVENKTVFDEQYTYKRSDGKCQKVWGLAFHKQVRGVHGGTLGKLEPIGEPY